MNILVDGRAFVKTGAGISTFLRCSLKVWANNASKDNFYLFLPKQLDSTCQELKLPSNVYIIQLSCFILRKIPNILLLLIYIPILCRRCKIDLFYSPVPFIPFFVPSKIKKVIVVHDVVNIEYKSTMTLSNRIATILFFNRSIRNADRIWSNSQYTKEHVCRYYPQRKSKEIFVGCSIDRTIFRNLGFDDQKKDQIKKAFGIENKMLLFVGSLEPRKNLSYLLSLMPTLYTKYGYQLIVIGGKGWKNTDIYNVVKADGFPVESVIFAGYISNEELVKYYNVADVFVSTSKNEGFGMPQLEALCCGCRVVTADNSAMHEVAVDKIGTFLVQGWNKNVWINAIVDAVNSDCVPNIEQLSDYNWDGIVKDFCIYLNN